MLSPVQIKMAISKLKIIEAATEMGWLSGRGEVFFLQVPFSISQNSLCYDLAY